MGTRAPAARGTNDSCLPRREDTLLSTIVQSASAYGTLMIMHADMVEHRVVCACTEPGADALPVRRALGPFRAPGVLHMHGAALAAAGTQQLLAYGNVQVVPTVNFCYVYTDVCSAGAGLLPAPAHAANPAQAAQDLSGGTPSHCQQMKHQ